MKENRKSNAISRRGFLGAAGVMAAAPVVGRASTIARPKEKFDAVYDVIVVGSGFAALASALRAREEGASVLLIEKMPAFGGNSVV